MSRDILPSFFRSEVHVLAALAAAPDVRMRDVAVAVGMTERNVQRCVAVLERDGFVTRIRDGRRNIYVVKTDMSLPHPLEAGVTVGRMLKLFTPKKEK